MASEKAGDSMPEDREPLEEKAADLKADVAYVLYDIDFALRELISESAGLSMFEVAPERIQRALQAWGACATYLEEEPEHRTKLLDYEFPPDAWIAGLRLRLCHLIGLLRNIKREDGIERVQKARK
jgi:hypothetical protein